MSFKKKMRIVGNQTISQYADNPYLINKENNKKRIPLWAKISIPSSLVAIGAVFAIVIANSLGTGNNLGFKQVNHPNKIFNSEHNELNPSYVQSIKDFATDFFLACQRLNYDGYEEEKRDEEKGNILFSPLSLSNELYMFYDATSGETREEIKNALHYQDNFNHLEEIKKMVLNTSIDTKKENGSECYSNISNALFAIPDYMNDIKQEYLDILTEYYFADVFEVNFNDDDSRKMIADYINSKTGNMFNVTPIPVDPNHGCRDGVCADDDTIDTSNFKLFDSTYLKANWNMSNYGTADFMNHDNTISKNIQFIGYYVEGATINESEDYYLISSGLASHIFNILLPKEDCTDNAILTKSINKLLNFETTNSFRAHLTFTMPEFENYRREPSTNALRKMGVQKLFDHDADYGNMFTKFSKEAHIDEIEHNVGISVDSRGIETSAYTSSGGIHETMIEELPQIEIIANHPFLYSITNQDGLPLYVGQIYKL